MHLLPGFQKPLTAMLQQLSFTKTYRYRAWVPFRTLVLCVGNSSESPHLAPVAVPEELVFTAAWIVAITPSHE
eukprot:scaffold37095_cov66-Cyclotella_meneghiniana.AAC.1